jgi:hypothetical protein
MEDFASPEACARVEAVHANAPLGVASLGAAQAMRVGEAYPVQLIVGRAERSAGIGGAARQLGQASTGEIRLAP